MTNSIEDILDEMELIGGSFVRRLALLYRAADPVNQVKLRVVFNNYFVEFDKDVSRIKGKK